MKYGYTLIGFEGQYRRAEKFSEIGLVLITFFGIITYLTLLLPDPEISCFSFHMCNAPTTLIFMLFIKPNIPMCAFDETQRKKYHKYTLSVILFLISIKTAMSFSSGLVGILEYQMIWTLANYGFYADFLLAGKGGLRTRNLEEIHKELFERNIADQDILEEPEDVPEPEFQESIVMKSQQLLKCKSCNNFYNENRRIPKILIRCGHSICKECSESIFRQKRNFYVTCPICFKDTYVNEFINVLPKNYAIMAMLQMAKEKKN
ncbi:unnamed protein product [Caenorhabditis brenneri]